MIWIVFNTTDAGLIAVQPAHVAAVYDEQGAVTLATTDCTVHMLQATSARRAIAMIVSAHRSDWYRSYGR